MKLSNTGINTYLQCPKKYFLHYREYLRPTWIGSALIFGGCMDLALNRALLDKKKSLSSDEKITMLQSPKEIFDENFENYMINNTREYISTSLLVSYYASDFEFGLLTLEDLKEFSANADKLGYDIPTDKIFTFYETIKPNRDEKFYPKDAELQLYNNLCWLSLRRKGHLMIEAYSRDIMPKIVEVRDIQKNIELPNKDGDILTGVIDYVAKFSDGLWRVMDNKTSSSPYTDEMIKESQQLAIYCEHEKLYNCGYTVLNKKLGKKDPRVKTQIVLGKIEDDDVEVLFDKIQNVLYSIKEEKFEMPTDDKVCFQYGQKCPYYNYCRTGEAKHLIKLEKR